MSQMEIRLTGWKAVLAVVIALAVMAYGVFARNTTLDTQAKEVIRQWVAAEYAGKALHKWEGVDYSKNQELAEQSANEILAALKVTIPSIKAKGSKTEPVVRVEILVDGKPPPDGKNTRYYKMNFSSITGWTMGYESSAFFYYSRLF